jgi:octaprenyl-diphosphate synthase
VGRAFQIADDLLDYVGDPRITGKPSCTDLREGKMTLPLILALREMPEDERCDLLGLLQGAEALTDGEISAVRAAIIKADGYRRTASVARRYVDSAIAALSSLPQSRYRDSLSDIAEYAVSRTK